MYPEGERPLPNGRAAAAIIAAAVGCAVIGLLTTLAAMSAGVNDALNFWSPAGSLTGKTTIGVIVWIILWVLLRRSWKERDVAWGLVVVVTALLLIVALALTFPPVFEVFE